MQAHLHKGLPQDQRNHYCISIPEGCVQLLMLSCEQDNEGMKSCWPCRCSQDMLKDTIMREIQSLSWVKDCTPANKIISIPQAIHETSAHFTPS